MTSALEESKGSVSNILFLTTVGQDGKDDDACHTADWLFLSHDSPSSLWQGGYFSFSSSFGIIVYEKKHSQWQTQTPGALQRLKASQNRCSSAPAATPSTGMMGWKDACLPVPPVVQPLPSFIFVKLYELFFNLSCLCAGFLERNSTVQWANPFRVCGRQGREMWRKVL